jgi:quercetin dioxygenase-like cupin family protein
MTRPTTSAVTIVCAIAFAIGATPKRSRIEAARQDPKANHSGGANGHTAVAPGDLKWAPGSTGISVAVLHGSPEKEGVPFVLRLKIPAGTRVPPHWHPVDEHLTVMTGTFYMGTGERFDESTATALTTGTYAMMPKDVRHFGWTGIETIVQIHGVGPFKTYFVEQPAK